MNNKKTISFLILFLGILATPFLVYGSQIDDTVTALYNTAIAIGGSLAVVGWVLAGGLYLTAAGNPNRMTLAKTAMVGAIIGTLLIVLAGSKDSLTGFIKGVFGIT